LGIGIEADDDDISIPALSNSVWYRGIPVPEGNTLHVYTAAGVEAHTLHVHTAGGGKG
jgi:hypothetical protein